ncbi:hypothetical protein OHT52_31275 [Streptomyces sp. NBC_00247]|uniref:hypothetical protein n=1 Tax=Streptomyces sp. NBC_00247 TaxID=2975689 RepID=UPI002E290180|nr:hypothetical protein [Streptomyces sp. NBC_00247]
MAWVRAGAHHQEQLRRTLGYLSAVGPVLAHPVAPAARVTAADLDAPRTWAREMALLPEPAPVVPRRYRDCGDRSTTVRDGRRADRVHARCGSCCECWCPDPSEDRFQPCGDLIREQCPGCRCCRSCVGCHGRRLTGRPVPPVSG